MRDGAPLMNGVLYGIDTRAAEEIETLTQRIGVDRLIETLRQRADLAVGRPEDPLAQEQAS